MRNSIAKATVEERAAEQLEPDWLLKARLNSLEKYFQLEMPSEREESWRKTDINKLDLSQLQSLPITNTNYREYEEFKDIYSFESLPAWLKESLKDFSNLAGLIYQGKNTENIESCLYLSTKLKQRGIIFCDMQTAIAKHPDLLKEYIEKSSENEKNDKFESLNKALFNSGFFLFIPKSLVIEEPFIFCLDLSDLHKQAVLPRIIVVAEENSVLNLAYNSGSSNNTQEFQNIENLQTDKTNTSILLSQFCEIYVKSGAKVNLLEIQECPKHAFYINSSYAYLEKDAKYASLTLALGGHQTKADITVNLNAQGAECQLLGLVLGANHEKFSFNTVANHQAPDTKSDINFRVALKDSANSNYQGMIKVDKIAQRTDAVQTNKNLLLDNTAKAYTIPKLEILADNVKCSHGATVGPVDPEQIFYLQSRGLAEQIAEELVVLGFFRQVIEQFSFDKASNWLNQSISTKMHKKQGSIHKIKEDER